MPRRFSFLALAAHNDTIESFEVVNGSMASAVQTVKVGDYQDPPGTVHVVVKMDHASKAATIVYMRQLPKPNLIVGASHKATSSTRAYNFVMEKMGNIADDEELSDSGMWEFATNHGTELIHILSTDTQPLPRATAHTNSQHHNAPSSSNGKPQPSGCAVLLSIALPIATIGFEILLTR